MNSTRKKKILLGITGGIAAYKSAELVRLFIKANFEVRVVMTKSAREFVQPLTYQALSGHRVYTDTFDGEADSAMDHIELARWADLMLIAPASSNTLAKLASGYADNLLLTLCLAFKKAVAVVPAMNQQMYANSATQYNIVQLKNQQKLIWGPASGEQACGDIGPGRMLEPEEIVRRVMTHFEPGKLTGKTVLITAGPTREEIDPVRYISNKSSGKMGYALARAASQAGASVILISGPVCLTIPEQVKRVDVLSAIDMRDAVIQRVDQTDIFIACAAVADYRVAEVSDQKIKKTSETMQINLTRNPDIVSEVAHLENKPFTVGFAAETQNLADYAQSKLERKNLDMIAANLVSDGHAFEQDSNELLVLWPGGKQNLAFASKDEIASQLIDLIACRYIAINER
ncbi:MAG: phosphopantothenoylcysteine decarboxylase/phosphopantothenate--cysteine ligase [Gammaproteobacteria bacterium]|jgi:phosphopantothenoylcysteine decarboxylase/phosphopantothenate--cysteine ligase